MLVADLCDLHRFTRPYCVSCSNPVESRDDSSCMEPQRLIPVGFSENKLNILVETNMHVIAQCPRYATAREDFSRRTGVILCEATYTDVMAINHNKVRVDKTVLAKALCAFLAHVTKKHASHNRRDFASVAVPLGCNQRCSIISPPAAERAQINRARRI